MNTHELLARLKQPAPGKIVLLVLDGLGDLRTAEQPATPLDRATIPNLDALAAKSSLGRLIPLAPGITTGSGPGHLALFGYDPLTPEADIGRGVLEALGEDIELGSGDVAARGNFATVDAEGRLTDRRAGRIETAECERLIDKLRHELGSELEDEKIELYPGEGHRFVLVLRGEGVSPAIADTDPQELGVPPFDPEPTTEAAMPTVDKLKRFVAATRGALADEDRANALLLRGFSQLPALPPMRELYGLSCGAFAGYPLYRGVARACGMTAFNPGKGFADTVQDAANHWEDFDFFFLHHKATDKAGEDGDPEAKARAIEEVDHGIPELLALGPEVLAITGDHSTPAPMKAHSFHPVPLLIHSPLAFVDDCQVFTESEATRGTLGTLLSRDLMSLLLAHCGRLKKFGA